MKLLIELRCVVYHEIGINYSYQTSSRYKKNQTVSLLTHSSSSAPSPSPALAQSPDDLLAIILSVHEAPALSSPAKLHFVTVPPSIFAKETEI